MTYTPQRSVISSITQANPAVVTTATPHGLTSGQVVRINIPKNFGMEPLNHGLFHITVLTQSTFSLQNSQVPLVINVDSTSFPAFIIPASPSQSAEILPVGSGPTPVTYTQPQIINGIADTPISDAWTNIATVNQPY